MKTLKTTFKIFLGIFLAILVNGNVRGQCIPSFSSTSDYISQVSFCTINNQTSCSTNGYGDYTNMVANVEAGESINIYIACVDDGIGSHGLAVWIDLNSNGIFDSEERIGAVNMPNNSSTTISYTIPQNQENGIYTMRVLYRYNEDANTVSPCTSGSYGEGEDYSIKIGESQIITPPESSEWTRCYDFENNVISIRFENDNIYPWTIINNAPNNNTYCLKSGNDGVHNSVSSIKIEVDYENYGAISFDAGIYGEGSDTYDWDKCRFYIDDELQFDYGAHARWENFEYEVTSGTHTFKWTYKKDGSVHPTGDAFFIDNICFDADMFLPISLLSFTASPQPEYNLVQWTTATEKNNDIFILERSEDAIVFDEVYNVSGAGNSLEPIDYEFRDYCPVSDITYYRLTQVDYDGSKTTSEIVSCIRTFEKKSNWEYFTKYDNLLQIHSNDKVLTIVCSDLLGRTIWQGKLLPHDDEELVLKVPYMVHIYEDGNLVSSEKMLK